MAGTNFKMKLRLRNRVAPECRIDEVISSFLTLSLGSNIQSDGLKLDRHYDSAAFLMLVKKKTDSFEKNNFSLSLDCTGARLRGCHLPTSSSHLQTGVKKISKSLFLSHANGFL